MLSDQIQKKVEDAEKIISEIESVKREYRDVLKDYNKLNKGFVNEKVNEDEYKEKLKQLESKDVRGSKGVKKIISLIENLKEINQEISKLFEVEQKANETKIDAKKAKNFAKLFKKGKVTGEKANYSTYSYNLFGKYANLIFDNFSKDLSRKYPEYFEALYKNLRMANIRVFSNT